MADKRELILAQLFAVLTAVAEASAVIKQAYRNRGELPDDKRPALVQLDANEDVVGDMPDQHRGTLYVPPTKMALRPEIFILLEQREPKNENVGQDVNGLRTTVLNAIFADAPLRSLLGSNGAIRYEGCITDLATGRAMQGELQLRVALEYVFKATELAAP